MSDKNGDGYNYIVFAETRGKAAVVAKNHTEGAFDDYEFTELRVLREPLLDQFYTGKNTLDWLDDADRTLMVQYAGFSCGYDYDPEPDECESCGGKPWCKRYKRMLNHEDIY